MDAGARLAAGGTYDDLFYRPTVLADVPLTAPAYSEEIFGPVAPIVRFDSVDDAVSRPTSSYGLSLGILTTRRHARAGDRRADSVRAHPYQRPDRSTTRQMCRSAGSLDSGTGSRQGGAQANIEAFTETQWVTVRGSLPAYPF